MVRLCSDLKSVQSIHIESFFRASTMLELHELCDGLMTAVFNITCICLLTNIP